MKLILNSFIIFFIAFTLNCNNEIYVKHVYTDFKKVGSPPSQPTNIYEITRVTTIRTPETINSARRKNIYYFTLPPILKLIRFALNSGEAGIEFLEDPENENNDIVLFKSAPDKYVMVTKMLCIMKSDETLTCQ